MSGLNFDQIADWGLSGLAFGAMFALCCYIATRALLFEVLATPVVQAIAKGMLTLTGSGKNGGDWRSVVASKIMDIMKARFGAPPEE